MTEINLFNYEEMTKAETQEESNQAIRNRYELTPCIKCGTLPIVMIINTHRLRGYKRIECPVCKFSCGTYYDPIEQWNSCNRIYIRGKEFE